MRSFLRSFCLGLACMLIAGLAGMPSVRSAPPDAPSAAAPAAAVFRGTPENLTITVPLGQTVQVPFSISNADTVPHTPQLYEAWPAPVSSGVTRGVVPDALRRVALPKQAARVDPQIAADIAAASDGRSDFLVFLADQPDLSGAYQIEDWQARGWFVYRTLYDHAARSQQGLRQWLDARGTAYRSLWIANALLVRGDELDRQALVNRSDVALLRANYVASLEPQSLEPEPRQTLAGPLAPLRMPLGAEPQQTSSGCQDDGTCWNITKVGGYRVWADFGVNGQGITIANIDSGVRYDHPALLRQYRGYRDANRFEHSYNWFDPSGLLAAPEDAGNHGTHTMGTMVGAGNGTADQPAVGIAPGAHWIAAQGCEGWRCTESDLLESAQWMLAPTDLNGNNARPDLRPQIINNSWADNRGGQSLYAGYVAAWRAAGIFPLFAAGNDPTNSVCRTVRSPADYANVVGVGATGPDDKIASFSLKGPALDGTLKPDLSAPGTSVRSTFAGQGLSYGILSGTSMSTPLVAGTVALLWSANPALIGNYDATYAILTRSAAPRIDDRFTGQAFDACPATSVPNNVYGYGRLDAYAAVAQARVDVPWLELPATSRLEAQASTNVNLSFDARRIPGPGVYTARLLIHSEDLTQSPVAIPIQMTVPPDPGYAVVNGRVYDSESGAPLAATVAVADGPRVATDAGGLFTLTLPGKAEPYSFSAAASGYRPQTQALALNAGVANTLAFSLTLDAPRIVASTAPLTGTLAFGRQSELVALVRNEGTQPLTYTLSVPAEQYGVWRSDEADGPVARWIEPPLDAVRVSLEDNGWSDAVSLGFRFPFYGKGYDSVYLSGNGFLAFTPPRVPQPGFSPSCLPIPETNGGAIVPLRADLDSTKDGVVRYALLDEGFLYTFEDVPLLASPNDTFTFQVLLTRDGRIIFNYKRLGTLPGSSAFGVQGTSLNAQAIGCGAQSPLRNNLTLELRPQPNAQDWMGVGQTTGTIAPGDQAMLPIKLRWTYPLMIPPYSGALLLSSNDPRVPVLRLPVRFTPQQPPSMRWLPWMMNS